MIANQGRSNHVGAALSLMEQLLFACEHLMPEYFYTATDQNGDRKVDWMEANSANEVAKTLKEKSFEDIVLHTDDIGALYIDYKKVADSVPPEKALEVQNGSSQARLVLSMTLEVVVKLWWIYALIIGLEVYSLAKGDPFERDDVIYLIVSFLLPVVMVGFFVLRGNLMKYKALQEYTAWGRWKQVLKVSSQLQGVIPEHELLMWEAIALRNLGRDPEALECLEEIKTTEKFPEWFHQSRLVEFYVFSLEDEDKVIGSAKKMVSLFPNSASTLTIGASALYSIERELDLAGEWLSQVRKNVVSDSIEPFLSYTEGMHAATSGQFKEAINAIEEAIRLLQPKLTSTPLIGKTVDLYQARLAILYTKLGESTKAESAFAAALPRLKALKPPRLLKQLEEVGFVVSN